MPSSYTPSLRLVLPVTGELQGTWGDTVNDGLTSLVDASIAGTASISMTDANYTLSTANGATDEARRMFVSLTGSLTAQRDVICPAASKLYFVHNGTDQAIVFKTSVGTGVTVPVNARAVLFCDGTNVVTAVNYAPSLTLGAALPVASGGTGATDASGARTALGLVIGTDVQAFDADNAFTNAVQSFTAAQRGTVVALTDGATITPDFAAGNNFSVTLGGNRTLANPTNLTAGQSGVIVVTQDGTGGRALAYGNNWKFPGGTAPTLTTAANSVDVIAYFVESSSRITARLVADVK